MTVAVFVLVLAAAAMHAGWNLLVKVSADRLVALFLIQGAFFLIGLGILAAFGLPDRASWVYVAISTVLHMGYNLFLIRAYRDGDLGLVYPVARGTAPLGTLLANVFLGLDAISLLAICGLLVLACGMWFVALSGGTLRVTRSTLGYALVTSIFISLYTLTDGWGARLAGSASAYTGLLYLFDGLGVILVCLLLRGSAIIEAARPQLWRGLFGAAMSGLAYWIVIWAMSVAPIPLVAALRETSVLVAVGFGFFFLKEKLNWKRGLGAGLVVLGAMALRL